MMTGSLRGWEVYWNSGTKEWRFSDTDEPTVTTWMNRPCGYCGLYGSSRNGDVDPCLGELAGVTNACCGHGNPDDAYICFSGGLCIRGFYVDLLHHRQLPEEEQRLISQHNKDRRKFQCPPSDMIIGDDFTF